MTDGSIAAAGSGSGSARPAAAGVRARRRAATALLAALCLLPAACTSITGGTARPAPAAGTVAGLPPTHGPTGLRPDAPAPGVPVDGGDGGRIDTIAASAAADLDRFWRSAFPTAFHRPFTPVQRLVSWDSSDPEPGGPEFCGRPSDGIANAGFCRSANEIGWDRGPLLTGLVDRYGELAPVVVLAHEYGHVVQYQAGTTAKNAPTIVLEQQADCYAGVFLRQVAEGRSEHFTVNTTDGLGDALAVLVGIRDAPDPDVFAGSEHGSGFERVTAFQRGFDGDPAACARIDPADVDAQRGRIGPGALAPGSGADAPLDATGLDALHRSLAAFFPLSPAPAFDTADPSAGCAQATSPAAYCPGTGRIGIDAAALRAAADEAGFAARADVASRYALAWAHAEGAGVLGDAAALRTACLTGAWAAQVAADPSGGLALRRGDLDQALSGLLAGGLIGADADGSAAPSAFARADAFRHGYDRGRDSCPALYP